MTVKRSKRAAPKRAVRKPPAAKASKRPGTPAVGHAVVIDANSETKLLREREVCERVGLSRSTIRDRIKKGTFPEPKKFGWASRWTNDQITAWIRLSNLDNESRDLIG